MQQDLPQATAGARALWRAGQFDEAISAYRAIVDGHPKSALARHNLAAALGDTGRWSAAEPHLEAALQLGLDAPETWLVMARCRQALGALDAAEAAYGEALRRRAGLADAHRELAQLRWMRTGDVRHALADIEARLVVAPHDPALTALKAHVLRESGDAAAAYAVLAALCAARADDGEAQVQAAQAALAGGEASAALAHAARGLARAPHSNAAHAAQVEALLLTGDATAASAAAEVYRTQFPDDQHAIALQATAWRILGDGRYGALYDYAAFVAVETLETPPGWSDLSAFLADLAVALDAAHHFRTHPFAQSVRHGSQAANVFALPHPAAQALPLAIAPAIRRYLAALGACDDPLRRRNRGDYVVSGAWSISMRAGGRHMNHVHPQGWISSAAYVEVPARPPREGWIKFGQPGIRTAAPLDAEQFVEPIPGRLVLFPSYMWHGTEPFSGDARRLTFAFDIAPG